MLEQDRNFVKGIINMLIASAFFAIMGAAVKVVGRDFEAIQTVFWRNVFGTLILFVSFYSRPASNKGGRPVLLVFRGVIGTLALYALFYNLATIEMGVAITFLQTSPIFVAVFSHFFLKERLKPLAWLAIFVGFSGILFIFRPSTTIDWTSNVLGLLNGVLAGAAYTSLRGLRNYYDSRTIVLSFTLSGLLLPVISMVVGAFVPVEGIGFILTRFEWPHGMEWFWLALVAVSALAGQMFLTKAYSFEKAGIMSAIGYMTIPMSIFIGTMMGDPLPDYWKIMGILLIILSGMIISIRKNR